jgi:predicted NUDIX family NTP pyrophosphohydrolase
MFVAKGRPLVATSKKQSAGILLYRFSSGHLEVFLVHPGGPFFANKDDGVWSLPKGEYESGEDPLETARREFEEETGRSLADCGSSEPVPLGSIVQRGRKTVVAWAMAGDWPEGLAIESNLFPLEWPPRSGHVRKFPEVDRGCFFGVEQARKKLNPAHVELLDRLIVLLERS